MRKLLSLMVALLFSVSMVAFAQDKPATDTGTSKVEGKSESVKTKKTSQKSSKKTKKSTKSKKSKKTQKPKQQSQ